MTSDGTLRLLVPKGPLGELGSPGKVNLLKN